MTANISFEKNLLVRPIFTCHAYQGGIFYGNALKDPSFDGMTGERLTKGYPV
jgi:hypothetical protein